MLNFAGKYCSQTTYSIDWSLRLDNSCCVVKKCRFNTAFNLNGIVSAEKSTNRGAATKFFLWTRAVCKIGGETRQSLVALTHKKKVQDAKVSSQ